MAENSAWNQVFAYADRLNYNSAMLNELGFAMAVEKLMGVDVPERAQFLRVVAGEVSRICDHITCIGAGAMELGAFTAFLYAVKAREYLYELLEKISGHRLTVNYMRVGGVWQDMPDGWDAALRQGLTDGAAVMREFHKLVTRHRIFFDRMEGVGIISQEDALAWGFTGPCLRSTGIDYDIRKAHPYSCYDRFDFDVPVGDKGDNYDRYLIRLEEIEQSRRIIEQALLRMPDGPVVSSDPRVALPEKGNVYNTIESMMNHFKLVYDGIRVPPGSVYSFSEVANGELGFLIVADGSGKPYRVRVRGPVFAIMQALPQMLIGGLIADIVPTFDGINMVAGELDR
jgi:NADH-quinone oxidoreductase subunit D